ncbi:MULTISPECIES: DUF2164 domain-containing protein [Pseudomonas]|jgi:uncharacterized protein (DUF2164 family)|uniref:DUF2164 domain-containing protein n=1 Tax=Pseudomonas TaxID=286 RepID=UPI00230684A6|nr:MULTISPECIES: DUF2164 domain-containing protein [Pseudomonas]WCE07740.1 DUF2164 domain-containing protein [Pseudomonas sp. JBR1]
MARKPSAPLVRLEPEQTQRVVTALQTLLDDSFEVRLGRFEVEELLDFFARECGPLYYNKAVADVQALLRERVDSLESDIWALEKP